jgi:hypothetical protein
MFVLMQLSVIIVLCSGLLALAGDSQESWSDMKELCNKATRTDSTDSESSASFYSARNSELSDLETSDDDEPLEQAYNTEPEILDDDWEPLDDYMFEEELFSTRTFDET